MAMNRRTFLQAAGLGVVGAGVGMTRSGWSFHKSDLPTIQPSYGDIENIQILGYNDMSFPPGSGRTGNWDQTYEFRVLDTPRGRFAYCGNGGNGWSIVDVSNPRKMHVVHRHPHSTLPDNTQYIDIKGGNILVVKRNRSLENWDVSNPSSPTFLGSFTPPDIHPTAIADHVIDSMKAARKIRIRCLRHRGFHRHDPSVRRHQRPSAAKGSF